MQAASRKAVASVTIRPDPSPAKSKKPPARVTLRCDWELPSAISREVIVLFERFASELGRAPYDIAWDRVFALERAGVMRLWTARTIDGGVLVGCIVCVWGTGLFTSAPYTRIEAGYLTPEWRGGLLGFRFIKSAVVAIEALNGGKIEWETNDHFEPDAHGRSRLAALLERLGFEQVGTTMRQR